MLLISFELSTDKYLGRNGNIYIKDPSRFGLEAGIEQSGDYEAFPISAFHQLHCLVSLSAFRD